MKLKTNLLLAMLLAPIMLFAQDETGGATAQNIVLWLTPFIVLVVTYIIKLVKPIIPSWGTLLIVTGLSTAVAWVSELAIGDDSSFWVQIGLGLLSVFINQVYRQFIAKDPVEVK